MPTGNSPRPARIHFFGVRPTFTLLGLRLLWFVIVVRDALYCGVIVTAAFGSKGDTAFSAYALATSLLEPLLRLVLLRLLLEVVAEVLVPRAGTYVPARSVETKRRGSLGMLRDFFLFQPVFNATGVTVVWIGYLAFTVITYAGMIVTIVRYSDSIDIASIGVATGLVTPFVSLGIVRVLVESAGRILPAAAASKPQRKPRRINVLLIGSGGREHALAWKIAQSPHLAKLYAAPGNPGIAECAELVSHRRRRRLRRHRVLPTHGRSSWSSSVRRRRSSPASSTISPPPASPPSGRAARRRASRARRATPRTSAAEAGIPTAAYRRFTDRDAAHAYLRDRGAPIVVKADGLAAGKGVTVAMTLDEALAAVDACFAGSLGAAGSEVVIEDYLDGEEASFFALSDGKTVLPLATAQDHKRAGEGDSGPNTGGMGAYSPAPVMTPALVERTLAEIVRPTLAAMAGARRALPRRPLCRADDHRRRPEAHRIQCPLRRPRGAGADDAPRQRPSRASLRHRRRPPRRGDRRAGARTPR